MGKNVKKIKRKICVRVNLENKTFIMKKTTNRFRK